MTTTRHTSSDSDSNQVNVEVLIQTYQAGIWRYLRSLGCEASEADDLTQDTFLAVLRKPFESYGAAATVAYLRKVAFNLFISARRKSGRVVLREEIEIIDKDWSQLASDDQGEAMLDALKMCVGGLSERARWALEMRFRDRLSREEIASALGITEHGAKNLMQRAKKQLKQCVEDKVT